jgi:hypothetical protein
VSKPSRQTEREGREKKAQPNHHLYSLLSAPLTSQS